MKTFQQTQLAFARHMRAPQEYPAPTGIEDRRLGIYRELVYNNIESLIATVFPVLRSLLPNSHWHSMVRDFIQHHECKTPYFLEISEEFLHYLAQERGVREGDPVFLLELAHYEWIELALDVSEESIPPAGDLPADVMAAKPRVSPLVAVLAYQYPVHKISPQYQPQLPEPVHLVVYRNRADKVCFMETNPLTQRLLSLLQSCSELQSCSDTLADVVGIIAKELGQQNMGGLADNALARITHLFSASVISHFE